MRTTPFAIVAGTAALLTAAAALNIPPSPAAAAPAALEVLVEIPLPGVAADWKYEPVTVVGDTAFIADDSRVFTMGVDSLALDDTLTLPASAGTITPTAAATLGGKAFFVYRTRQVVVVDGATRAITVIPAVCGTGARIIPWLSTHANHVYVGCDTANFVARINATTLAVDDTFTTGATNKAMVVIDDTAYITNDGANSVTRVNVTTSPPTAASAISVGSRPHGIASYDDSAFVANYSSSSMSIIKTTASPPTVTSVSVGSSPVPAVSCGAGIYTARRGTSEVMVVNPLTQAVQSINNPSISDPGVLAADQGRAYALSINNRGVTSIDCSTRQVDDSLTLSVGAGYGNAIAFSPYRAFVTATGGPNGTLVVIQTSTPPPPTPAPSSPPPPVPASEPLRVTAREHHASAEVSWSPPASAGSFAVSHYLVTSSPGRLMCLSSATSCSVAGLAYGTTYTFTVQALTGAGWSAQSQPSNPVTPKQPTITISGIRDGDRVVISGTSLGPATVLRPWTRIAGEAEFRPGLVQVAVAEDGTFTWSRRAGNSLRVLLATEDGSVRSNVISLPR